MSETPKEESETAAVAVAVEAGEAPETTATATATTEEQRQCCSCNMFHFKGNHDAIGYNYNVMGRGFLIIANLMLNTSLLWLASNAAGCFDDPDAEQTGACNKRIHGMLPSTFIANIATFSGLGSALLMPITGAYVDFTPHRREWGIWSAVVMTLIQFTQIFTYQDTWLGMNILQIFAIISYQVQNMVGYAYEPEIAREVGEHDMGRYTAHFTSNQFGAQCVFLLVIAAIQAVAKPSPVQTGQISQALNTLTCIVFFGICWFKYMSPRQALRKLPPDTTNIVVAGLRQNWETVLNMQRYFKKGLRWFFLAVIFSRACGSAITTLSVIYLQDTLKLGQIQIVIFFLATMVGCLPGPHLGLLVTRRWDPSFSYLCSNINLFVVLITGVFVLEFIPQECAYLWGFLIGMSLGWFYSTENLFFSMVLPKGQAAELSGFFVCCTQILVWLPPVFFIVIIENDIAQKYGWLPVGAFLLIGVGFLMMTGSWEEIVSEAEEGFRAIEAAKKENESGGGGGSGSGGETKADANAIEEVASA